MKQDANSLLIAGGGTGGHVFPAIAVAREWLGRKPEGERSVVIVGTERGMEARLVPQAGLPLETIRVAGLEGHRRRAISSQRSHSSAGTVGLGKDSAPAQFWSRIRRGRVRIRSHDASGQDAFDPHCDFRAQCRAGIHQPRACDDRYASGRGQLCHCTAPGRKSRGNGCPVRQEFFAVPRKKHGEPFTILITGGSRGALPINRAVVDSLDLLSPRKNQLFIVHQTGERDYNAVRVAYARREFRAEVVPFIENMAERFAQADLIVCRSGAITVAEVSAAGRAAIFIPFGAATDAHQTRNAEAMQDAGAARMLPQGELTPERLTSEIFSLLDQPGKIAEMEERAHGLARPRAVEDIVDLLEAQLESPLKGMVRA